MKYRHFLLKPRQRWQHEWGVVLRPAQTRVNPLQCAPWSCGRVVEGTGLGRTAPNPCEPATMRAVELWPSG